MKLGIVRRLARRKRNIGAFISTGAAATSLVLLAFSSMPANAIGLKELQNGGTIRVAVGDDIPYGYMNPQNEAKGAGPDVARAVLKAMGADPSKIQWIETKFSSLIPGLRAGRFDMAAAEMAVRPERCRKVIYSEPNTSYGEGLLVLKGNPKNLHTYADFAKGGLKVAIMAGADQLNMLHAVGVSDSNILTVAANSDAISTVRTGRADAFAATGLTVTELAKKNDKVELAPDFTDPVIDGKPARSWGAFAFADSSKKFRDAFNVELAKFKKTDQWKKILSGYGFTPTDISQSFTKTTEALCAGK
jgi:polar amino acid transport system substrate-binding protein